MPIKTKAPRATAETMKAMRALQIIEERVSFGPLFFMQVLRGFVRGQCPDPSENIPNVFLRLMDGQSLALCHIIAISPNWLALAVHDEEHPERREPLRTEIVPYPSIGRITIEAAHHDSPIGFNTGMDPQVFAGEGAPSLSPEDALKAVATVPPKKVARPRAISEGSRPASRRRRAPRRTK